MFLCRSGKTREVYNLVDDADSTQGSLVDIISDIFQIRKDFYGTAASHLAKVSWFAL